MSERFPRDSRFLAAALLLCAAGATWLLLSPSAFERRALARRAERLETRRHGECARNMAYASRLQGLRSDPSVIEREARRLGYGLPGERTVIVPLAAAEMPPAASSAQAPAWSDGVGRSVAPVLMLVVAVAAGVLFFSGMKVEDPGAAIEDEAS